MIERPGAIAAGGIVNAGDKPLFPNAQLRSKWERAGRTDKDDWDQLEAAN
jgi:hypothetical protein